MALGADRCCSPWLWPGTTAHGNSKSGAIADPYCDPYADPHAKHDPYAKPDAYADSAKSPQGN